MSDSKTDYGEELQPLLKTFKPSLALGDICSPCNAAPRIGV